MINKNDPLVAAIQKVMQSNQAERDAVATVNEKFGVTDRRALPRERQHEWDSAYNSILTEGINVPDVSYKKTEKNGNSERTIMTKDTKNVFSGGTRTYQNVDKSNDGSTLTTKIKSQDLGKNKELGGKNYNVSTSTVYKKVDEEALEEKSFAALAPPYDKATHKDKLVGAGVLKKHPTKPGKHVLAKEALHPNQQKLDVHEPEKDELTKKDFEKLRAMGEEKKMKGDDPCWKGYQMVGMKKKGGREVPNCVPVNEEGNPSKAIRGDVVTGGSSVTSVAPKEKSVQPSDQSALKKKIQGIMKEAKSNAYAIGMASVQKSTGDKPPMKKKNIKKAHDIAKKIMKKKLEEGFNDRHDSSVNASVSEQVVADQLSEIAVNPANDTPAARAYRDAFKSNQGKPALPLQGGQKLSPIGDKSRGRVAKTTNRFVKPKLDVDAARKEAQRRRESGQPVLQAKDVPGLNRDPGAIKAAQQRSDEIMANARQGGRPLIQSPSVSTANRDKPGAGPGQGSGAPTGAAARLSPAAQQRGAERDKVGVKRTTAPKSSAVSTAGKDTPGTGPGQGSGAPTGPQNVKMATQNTQGNYDNMSFSQAFAAARKQAGGASGKFKYKGKEYQTNVKGTGTATKPQEKYQAASKLKTVAPPTQTTTTNSVAGGQGIAALPSRPSSVGPKPSGAQVMTNPTQRAYDKNNPSYSGSGVSAPVRPSAGVGPNNAQVATSAPKQKPTFGGPR